MDYTALLASLGHTLPPCPTPLAAYVPATRTGNLIFVSGQLPVQNGTLLATGSVPELSDVETAKKAAAQCFVNGLSAALTQLQPHESTLRLLLVQGFVQSSQGFSQQPQVVNGASELAIATMGDLGKHARAAVGVASLPLNASVEVAFQFEVVG